MADVNRTLRTLVLAAGGAAAATAAYAVLVEPKRLQRTRPRLHFPELPPLLEGLTIALITDIHAGAYTPRDMTARVVRLTMEASPDVIAITGDLAEDEGALEATLDELARLSAPLGVYVVPGNHDYTAIGEERWHDAVARRRTLTDLTNRVRTVRVGDVDGEHAVLCIAGMDDLVAGRPRLDVLPPQDRRDFTILLAHQPDQAERARRGRDRVDLVLSGHTHGGQVRLPGIGAVFTAAERADLYEGGLRRRPWTQVYTSRGIGTTHLPIRFLSRPELPVLTLTSAPRPPRRLNFSG